MIRNGTLFELIRIFLEDREVAIPDYVSRKKLVRIRVIAAIWSETELGTELNHVWARYETFHNVDLIANGAVITP